MQVLENTARLRNQEVSSHVTVGSDDSLRAANETVKKVQETVNTVQKELEVYKRIDQLEQKIADKPEEERKVIQAEIDDLKVTFKNNLDQFLKSLGQSKELIKELNSLSIEAREDSQRIVDLTKTLASLQDELKAIKGGDSRQEVSESKTAETKIEIETQKNTFSKIEFRERNARGQEVISNEYLKVNEDGKLMVWASTGKILEGKPEYSWQTAEAHNQKPGVQKTICLYQKSDGSFVDQQGKPVTSLRSSLRGCNVSTKELSSYVNTEEGKVSSVQQGYVHDYTYQGARVVFSKYKESEKVENTSERTLSHQKISFSARTCNGGTIRSEKYMRLDEQGKLQAWERNSNIPGQMKGHSWISTEELNKQPYRMKYECLYQEADGSFTDVSGKKVTHLDSYRGRVPLSSLTGHLQQRKEGEISGFKENISNEYFHNGAHVVFTKRVSATEENSIATIDKQQQKATSKTENTSETKQATQAQTTQLQSNVEAGRQEQKQNEVKAQIEVKTQKPWRKVDYDETDRSGMAYAKTAYTRVNEDNKLEVFAGTNARGQEVWLKEEQSKFKSVYVYQGKVFDSKGEEITYLGTGRKEERYQIDARHISKSLQFDESGIGTLPNRMLREHHLGGKQVVFIEGKPPFLP